MKTYTYTEHDGGSAATEKIVDEENNTEMIIQWLKVADNNGAESWGARISGKPINPQAPNPLILYQYIGTDEPLDDISIEQSATASSNHVVISGHTQRLGQFEFSTKDSDNNNFHLMDTAVEGMQVPSGEVWQALDVLRRKIIGRSQDRAQEKKDILHILSLANGKEQQNSNLYFVQQLYGGEWSTDVYFNVEGGPVVDEKTLDAGLKAASLAFDENFEESFKIEQRNEFSSSQIRDAKDAIANLLGGIGYFFGRSLVDGQVPDDFESPLDPETYFEQVLETDPKGLLTSTPSRSFFPRGFFWDEGFHLVAIDTIRPDLCVDITESWLNLLDEDGWVGREQILGEEARSRVPREFQVQKKWHANPPVLILGILHHIESIEKKNSGNSEAAVASGRLDDVVSSLSENELDKLKFIYRQFQKHYEWFHESQRGQLREWEREAPHRNEGFRWKGRTKRHVLTSGLDDYPRPNPSLGELHVDLHSWMGFYAGAMAEFAHFLGFEEDEADYIETRSAVIENVVPVHWSDEFKIFCDAGLDEEEESILVCHPGYVSIMPLVTGILPVDAPQVGDLLTLISDKKHLWTPYGIASLSQSHPMYGTDENYWRGPIWMPINYMLLRSLYRTYASTPGPYQTQAAEIYSKLRSNLINNVLSQYETSGYYWEQYDSKTGKGQRSHPFTGWTALVANIMAENY